MIKIIINKKQYEIKNKLELMEIIAFAHYPLNLKSENIQKIFSSFDDAKQFIEEFFEN